MAAITMFKVILFLSFFISVWTLPTIVRRQSDNSPCTAQLKDLKKGLDVSRIVLYNTLRTKENLKYQAVAGIRELMDLHNKLQNISEGDTEISAVNSVLNATLSNACYWIGNISCTREKLDEVVHKVMLMSKILDVIGSIESSIKSYESCSDLDSCQWIDEYVINDTSILNCTKQYVLDYGPGLCKKTLTTTKCS